MQKITSFIFILSLLGFLHQSFAQNNDVLSKLVGKRWGLSYFIEQNANLYDTLIRVHDCQNEFIEITANGRFLTTDLEKEGTWTLNGETLTLKKGSGSKYKTLTITKLTNDTLIMTDKKKKSDDVFIEVYKVCDINDTTFIDTREIKEIRRSWSVIAGGQYFKAPFAELGLVRNRYEWNNVLYAASLNLELAPWNSHYGASLNFWSEDILLYGAGVVGYVYEAKIKDVSSKEIVSNESALGVRPMLGLSLARLLHPYGMTAHLAYSYTFFLGEGKKLDKLNQHAISLRVMIPFYNSKQKVRRIVKQDVEY